MDNKRENERKSPKIASLKQKEAKDRKEEEKEGKKAGVYSSNTVKYVHNMKYMYMI